MQVLSFLTQKGGSGKSTLAASVAVAAFEEGRRVFILELDKQGTMSDWYDTRQAEEGPDFERIDTKDISTALETLRASGYDLVVIDTPGIDNPDINFDEVQSMAAPTAARRANATKQATVQQTVYLQPAVHDQLRELAFSERVKMHAIIMEGLDAVFRQRGLKSIEELMLKP